MSVVIIVFTIVAALLALVGLVLLLLRQKSSLIFGKYPSKGFFYQLKYPIALLAVKKLRNKLYKGNDQAWSQPEFLEKLDKPQALTDNPQSYDVVCFMGANEKGEKLMVSLERRRRGVLKACLYIWLPETGLLGSPNLPDMVYFTTDGDEENFNFEGSGFKIYPEESMRLWRVQYEGELKEAKSEKLVKVKLDFKFNSTAAHFNYNRDLSASVIADSVARESWNDAFYGMLKHVDDILEKRVHYEQSGAIEGIVQIDNNTLPLSMKGTRDHSFGTDRCLSTINRYVYFALFLDDGTSMVVGNLSQPSFFLSSLKVGYVCLKGGNIYLPITECNFELYSYGEKGKPPKHQNFIVETELNKYFVQITVEDTSVRYIGGEWHSKVFNQFVSCTVNGITGHGITEYLYRNTSGRPVSVSCKDPEWYQRVRTFERSLSTCTPTGDEDDVFIF